MANLKKIILLLAIVFSTAIFNHTEAAPNPALSFVPLATTYSDGDSAFLSLIRMREDNSIYFLVTDSTTYTMGFVMYSRELYDFYIRRGLTEYPPLIFLMMIPGQRQGELDSTLGEWNLYGHILPVYALFDIAQGGKIICRKPFYSADTVNPANYQAVIRNPRHTRLVEIFMTQMPLLHKVVRDNAVALP